MGKLYYCDYCDRSFKDNLQARKKHLQSIAHLRNRKLHYSSCRDLETLVEEESLKEECYKFKKFGQCQFGDNCFRSHLTKQQLNLLRNQINEEKSRKILQNLSELKTMESWLQERSSILPLEIPSGVKNSFHIPYIPQQAVRQDLPPSLQPLNLRNLKDAEISEWG